jgi:excisionase family DNA binding protein
MTTQYEHKDKLLTREEAAQFLGVATKTLNVWACTGRYQIPTVKVGRLVRYRLSHLEEFLERRTITKEEKT